MQGGPTTSPLSSSIGVPHCSSEKYVSPPSLLRHSSLGASGNPSEFFGSTSVLYSITYVRVDWSVSSGGMMSAIEPIEVRSSPSQLNVCATGPNVISLPSGPTTLVPWPSLWQVSPDGQLSVTSNAALVADAKPTAEAVSV